MQVEVVNRQRLMPVDRLWWRQATSSLSEAVCVNLQSRPPAHLSAELIDKLGGAQLSVVLVSDRTIRSLNYKWRQIAKTTDVLSFPIALTPPPGDLPWQLGEVVISLERAEKQASLLGHSLGRELAFLFVHGVLHVLGFDHIDPEDEKEMFSRQEAILAAAGFSR